MFRSERLDFNRPTLRSAADAALDLLAGTVRAPRGVHEMAFLPAILSAALPKT
jgi:hypothetical protein